MFFVGIDVGKRNHEIALIDEKGISLGKTIRIANTKKGNEELLNFFSKYALIESMRLLLRGGHDE